MENSKMKKDGISTIDRYFKVTESGSTIKKEVMAGIITFLAMAYILTVNPTNILYPYGPESVAASVSWASLFMATAIGAVVGTLLMALFAKMPLAQAPGMGLNFTVGTVLLGAVGGIKFGFGQAMLLVLISGVVFLLLSIVPCKKDPTTGRTIALRELIFDGMPDVIRKSITVGIGLFIAFIGLKNASVIVNNAGTYVSLVAFNDPEMWHLGGAACNAVVCLFGLIVIAVLSHYNVKGSIIIGILAATVLALPLGVADIKTLAGSETNSWAFWNNFASFFSFNDESAFFSVFTQGFSNWNAGMIPTAIVLVITFCMIDMFDTMGTVVGCTTQAGLVDENGKPLNYNKIMVSDSVATLSGAIFGTSTVTTFVESASGIAAGGKTGLTSLVTALLFFLSIFAAPLFEFIPSAACAPALIYVGVLMMGNVTAIDFKTIKNAIPAFMTIIMMPLTYSITNGIGIGIITYVLITFISYVVDLIRFKNNKLEEKPTMDISVVLLVVFVLFLVYFLLPTSF